VRSAEHNHEQRDTRSHRLKAEGQAKQAQGAVFGLPAPSRMMEALPTRAVAKTKMTGGCLRLYTGQPPRPDVPKSTHNARHKKQKVHWQYASSSNKPHSSKDPAMNITGLLHKTSNACHMASLLNRGTVATPKMTSPPMLGKTRRLRWTPPPSTMLPNWPHASHHQRCQSQWTTSWARAEG